MLVHSKTMAPRSGLASASARAAATLSERARSTLSSSSLSKMARVNSCPPSVVPIGVPAGTRAFSRCSGVSVEADIVSTPARLSAGRMRLTCSTCISDDEKAAAAVNRRTLSGYVTMPNYRNYWKEAGYVEEMEAIFKWFKTTSRAIVWLGVLAGSVTAIWALYSSFIGS